MTADIGATQREYPPACDEAADAANLPPAFWAARPELADIQTFAYACAMAADALLGSMLARVCASVPPSLRLPSPVGIDGSLNLAVALVAPSGAGKSTAIGAAGLLLPVEGHIDLDRVPVGSGEGAVDAYFDLVTSPDPKQKPVKVQTRHRVLFVADEGEAIAQQGRRNGSTLLTNIRSLTTGGHVGQRNATAERTRELKPHTYRAGIVMAIQPLRAGDLLEDADGGTPQRFIWFAGTDPAVPAVAPTRPQPMLWEPPPFTDIPAVMTLDSTAALTIRTDHLERVRSGRDDNALDSHRNLNRLKVAGLLALFADPSSRHISLDDWDLAGQVIDASDRVRATIQRDLRADAHRREEATARRGAHRAVVAAAATEDNAEARALRSGAVSMGRKLWRDAPTAELGRSDLTTSTSGKHRRIVSVDDMIAEAEALGYIGQRGDKWTRGRTDPR